MGLRSRSRRADRPALRQADNQKASALFWVPKLFAVFFPSAVPRLSHSSESRRACSTSPQRSSFPPAIFQMVSAPRFCPLPSPAAQRSCLPVLPRRRSRYTCARFLSETRGYPCIPCSAGAAAAPRRSAGLPAHRTGSARKRDAVRQIPLPPRYQAPRSP